MSKRKRKKSIFQSTFYRVYFALVLLALIGIAVGTAWLKGVLRDYESAQPVYVAEDVAKLFEDGDFDALYALDTSAGQIAEGDEAFYVQSMGEYAEGKDVAWSELFSGNEDERKYAVTLDGERFATFTLVPSGQTTKRGNRLWTLGSVTTNVVLHKSEPEPTATPEPTAAPVRTYRCTIVAPKGYAVTVDGEALSEDNALVSEKNLFGDGFLPDGVQSPVLVTYLYDADSVTPAITATDESGRDATVAMSTDKALTWSCELPQDDAYRQKFSDAAFNLAKRVAKYISQDAEKSGILKVCAANSPAAEIFENLGNQYTTPHSRVGFENENADQFYVLSENCFTCRVTFDYIMSTSLGRLEFPTSYTFCVVHDENSARLYNILMS